MFDGIKPEGSGLLHRMVRTRDYTGKCVHPIVVSTAVQHYYTVFLDTPCD